MARNHKKQLFDNKITLERKIMKMIASLVIGALLLFAREASTASLFSAKSMPNTPKEGIPFLPIASTNEVLTYATNSVSAIYFVLEFEDPNGWIEYEGKTWSQFDYTGFAWRAATSEVSLGKTVEQSLRDWLNYNINILKSFNPANPGETYFRVGVGCDATTPDEYPTYYGSTALFQSYKVFRLVKNGSEYVVPEEASKGSLQYWPFAFEQVDIIVPGLDWARVETPDEVLDTRDYPEVTYNFRGRLFNGSFQSILNFPSRFVGTKTKGKVTLHHLSGAEQEFDLATGRPVNFKPLSISIRPGRKGEGESFVTVEGTPTGEMVHLQGSINLTTWEDIAPPISDFTGTSTFRVSSTGLNGFFRAVFHNTLELRQGSP